MSARISFENCLAFINRQWTSELSRPDGKQGGRRNVVTISRQVGSGAHAIAEQLANRLSPETSPQAAPWTVFDRNLIEKVLEDLRLPARLAQHLPEDRASDLEDIMDDLFGMRPPSWAVVQQTAETILRLARLGKVILIGRGATLVTARLPNVVRIRLVAPLEQRIALVQKTRKLTAKAAAAVVPGGPWPGALPEKILQGRHQQPPALPSRDQHRGGEHGRSGGHHCGGAETPGPGQLIQARALPCATLCASPETPAPTPSAAEAVVAHRPAACGGGGRGFLVAYTTE